MLVLFPNYHPVRLSESDVVHEVGSNREDDPAREPNPLWIRLELENILQPGVPLLPIVLIYTA